MDAEKEKSVETAALHDNTISPRDDRRDRGRILHEAIPHASHAKWSPAKDRLDPVDIVEAGNIGRIPELAPLRYGRMLVSPFTFFRGTAAIMAGDLATTPYTKVRVQACGDSHLLNFGAFNTPERNVVFDLNDFDETLPAPWEWDVKRLAVSYVLAARDNGLKEKFAVSTAQIVARAYRKKMLEYSRMSILDIWYDRIDWSTLIEKTSDPTQLKKIKAKTEKASRRTIQGYYFPKMAEESAGGHTFKDSPPTLYHLKGAESDAFRKRTMDAMELYKKTLPDDKQRLLDRYKLADVAIKVVGVGSVGTTCAVALMLAPDTEPLILQLKEARASVLEPFAGKSEFENHGQRVVVGQKMIQSASDIFLGWTQFDDGKHFYIRQLRDGKVKLEPENWDGQRMEEVAELMGLVLARAHARSGDAALLSGYLGEESTFEEAIADFAIAYSDQVEKDYEKFAAAVRTGRLPAATDLGT